MSVLVNAGGKMRSDAHIHRAAVPVGHDVYPSALLLAFHCVGIEKAGHRVKPGVTLIGGEASETVLAETEELHSSPRA